MGGFVPAGEEFFVAFGAGDGGFDEAQKGGGGEVCGGEGEDFGGDAVVYGGVADDALAFVCFLFGGFELGFDEGDEEGAGFEERPDVGEYFGLGDEGDVHHGDVVSGFGEECGIELAGVDAFEVGYAWVVTEFGMELAVADIYAGDVGGAVLEEAVGEASGGGADVEGIEASNGEVMGEEEALELFASAADEAGWGQYGKLGIFREFFACFVEHGGAVADFAGEDEGFGLGTGFGKAAKEKEFVEPDFSDFGSLATHAKGEARGGGGRWAIAK